MSDTEKKPVNYAKQIYLLLFLVIVVAVVVLSLQARSDSQKNTDCTKQYYAQLAANDPAAPASNPC